MAKNSNQDEQRATYSNKGIPRRLDYMEIYYDFKGGMSQKDIMIKHCCSRQSLRFITSIGYYFETRFLESRKDLEAYNAKDLMQRLAALGYRGTLSHIVETDITNI